MLFSENVMDQLDAVNNSSFQTLITYGVSKPLKNFTGRQNEMGKLSDFHNSENELLSVVGLGGMGKSELVKKFVNNKLLISESGLNVIWLRGENEQTLKESLFKAFNEIKKCDKDNDSIKLDIEVLIKKLFKQIVGNLLIVIDNVDEKYECFNTILELLIDREKTKTIITTRQKNLFDEDGDILELFEFTKEEAMEMVQKGLSFSTSIETVEISKLCDSLQNFPLALQQVIAYIVVKRRSSLKGKSYGVIDYLKEYEKTAKNLLGHKLSKLFNKYDKTTLTTWSITTDTITNNFKYGRHAIALLDNLSYLNPDAIEI